MNSKQLALRLGMALLVVTVALLAATSPVVADNETDTENATLNDTAPYYNNSSSEIDEEAWFAGYENVTLDSMVGMAMRLGPFIIGTGPTIPGGVGYAGPIVLGLVVSAVFLGTVAGTGMGSEAGSVVALVVAYGLIEVGLAPEWVKVVVLMLLGTVAAVVLIRAAR